MQIAKEIFRAYDIRGIVDQTLTTETVFQIGKAIGTKVLENGEQQIVVGRDGRLSGPTLMERLIAGLISTGCNVIDIGMAPTPVLYFATHILNATSGIIITGSHNPSNYNGLKIVLNRQAIHGEEILGIYDLIKQQDYKTGQGKITQQDLDATYIDYIKNSLNIKHHDKPCKIVVDCGNGVPGIIAPELYQQLGYEVIPLYCDVDGTFPNHHPDPGDPKNLQDLISAIKTHKADLGIAFDGDGDRLGIVDNTGKIIWPDRLLMLLAQEVLESNPNSTIIYDVKCSNNVPATINKYNGKPLMWKTGHSLIKAKMKETNATLAGEMSGHIFFKDRWFGFDDALYSGARLLEILSHTNKPANEIFAELPESISTPELTIPVTEESKFSIVEKLITTTFPHANKVSTIDGLRVDFTDGWGLVRSSNTTPKLVARFEAQTTDALKRIQSEFKNLLLEIEPKLVIPF